jgi:hypothetical protein
MVVYRHSPKKFGNLAFLKKRLAILHFNAWIQNTPFTYQEGYLVA